MPLDIHIKNNAICRSMRDQINLRLQLTSVHSKFVGHSIDIIWQRKIKGPLWMHCSHSQLTVFSWSSLRGQGVGLLSLRHPFGWYDLMHSGLFIGSEDSTNSHDLVLLTFDGRRSLTQHSHHLTSLRGCWARLGQRCHVRLGMARIKNQKPQIPAFTTRRTGNINLYTWHKMSKP